MMPLVFVVDGVAERRCVVQYALEQAGYFAERLKQEAGAGRDAQIARAVLLSENRARTATPGRCVTGHAVELFLGGVFGSRPRARLIENRHCHHGQSQQRNRSNVHRRSLKSVSSTVLRNKVAVQL